MSLKGKAALITGATSGIGLGIARAMAAAGADVMINGFGDAAADRDTAGRHCCRTRRARGLFRGRRLEAGPDRRDGAGN